MKKPLAVLVVLVCIIGILCGCDSVLPDQTVTCEELTITLPGHYIDLSGEDYAAGLALLYGFNDTAITAIKEDKASLQALIPDMDAQQYAELFVASNSLLDTVEVVDGIPTFQYCLDAGDTSVTYLCGVFESDSNFWVIQAYCPTTGFAESQEALWGYITTVTIA